MAVPLGAWLRAESVSPMFALGAAVVMAGVYIGVVRGSRRTQDVLAPAGTAVGPRPDR